MFKNFTLDPHPPKNKKLLFVLKIINGKVFQTLLHYLYEYFGGGGVYKIFLDPTPKIKIIICKVFEHYSITFKNIWGRGSA